jgi:hypothetical protein
MYGNAKLIINNSNFIGNMPIIAVMRNHSILTAHFLRHFFF